MSEVHSTSASGGDLSAGVRAILAHTGKPRLLVRDEPLRNTVRNGQAGFEFSIDLPSYRSLPLSCIEAVTLKVDGAAIDPTAIRLVLNGYSHTLQELEGLSNIWWFILDPAALFIQSDTPLTPGTHQIEADVVTVEPYVTAGRFSFHHPVTRTLTLAQQEEAAR